MTREEILEIARELEMGVHARLTEHGLYADDIVTFAELIASRAVEEYKDAAAAEFEASVQEMLSVYGKRIESGVRDE